MRQRLPVSLSASATLLVVVLMVASATSDALAVKPDEVFVKASTSFDIDPSRGYQQYYGKLSYTRVDVVRPTDATLSRKVIKKARKACLRLFVNGDGAYFPAFIIYDDLDRSYADGGIRRLSTIDPFAIDAAGNWYSKGFNSNPNMPVRAQGGFWSDKNYNFRSILRATTFKVGGKMIVADCDGDLAVEKDYPG